MRNGFVAVARTASLARRAAAVAVIVLLVSFLRPCVSQTVSVLTQHNDLTRDGANPNEEVLTTSNVNEASFGKLFSLPVDGFVFAQPLYVSQVSIPNQGTHSVLYVATEHDSVYAFDADSAAVYWQVSLGTSVPSSVLQTIAIQGELGITGTPVIDPVSGTLYVVALSWEDGNSDDQSYHLHALDITTGAEKFGGPVEVSASVNGSAPDGSGGIVPFVTSQHLQRPALTLVNGIVYLAFGSHDDIQPYHGWVLGYDAQTLKQVQVFNTTPNSGQGAVWMGGQGLVADSSNGESILKLTPSGSSLTLTDYFQPALYDWLNAVDGDTGSGGVFAIPGTSLIAGAGKLGELYLIDTNNMGELNTSGDRVVQEFGTRGGMWGAPAFWNNTLYYWGVNAPLQAFEFNGSTFKTTASSQSAYVSPPGETSGSLSISSNGTTSGTAIVWATTPLSDSGGFPTVGGDLYAFDARNVTNPIWSTAQNESRDGLGTWGKFVAPTVANGKVYIATNNTPGQIAVYGLFPTDFSISISAPLVAALPGGSAVVNFSLTPVSNTFQGNVTLTASGLPQGASYVFSPASIAAGVGTTAGTLTINIPGSQAVAKLDTMRHGAQLADKSSSNRVSRLAAFSLALVLMPFAVRLRHMGQRLGRLLSILMIMAASMGALAEMTACGSASSVPPPQSQLYTVTVTATSGSYSQTASFVLSVQ
jgi:hypothetical protein